MSIFDKIKDLSNKRGKNLKSVAREIGIGENSIYKWKTQSPTAESLKKVAIYFNVSSDYLLDLDDDFDDKRKLIAAQINNDLTNEELKEIFNFIEYIQSKRNK